MGKMVGLPERTIVISHEDAKEYVASKLMVLTQVRDGLQKELDSINEEIDIEMNKLEMLNNPPAIEEPVVSVRKLPLF